MWQDLQKAISESQAKQRIDHKSHECCKKYEVSWPHGVILRMTEAHSLGILDGTAWQNGTTLEGYLAGVSGRTPHTFRIIRHMVIGPQNFSECHSNHSIFSPTHLEISFGKAHRKWTEKLWRSNKHINTKGTTSIGHHILELLQATLKELNSHISKVRPEVAKTGLTWANGIPVGAPKLCSLHCFEGREWDIFYTPKIQCQKYWTQSSSLAKCQEKVTSATLSTIFFLGGLDQLGAQVDAVKAKYKEEAAQADHAALFDRPTIWKNCWTNHWRWN